MAIRALIFDLGGVLKFRLGELVDLMLFDGEEGVAKPDARIYQLALMRLGVQPHEVVFVDDKERNVEAAGRLGIYTVHFKNTAQAITEIQTFLNTAGQMPGY